MAKVRVGVSLGLVRVSDRISLWLVSVRVMIPKPKSLTLTLTLIVQIVNNKL